MATVEFRRIKKVFPDGTRTISDFSLAIENAELVVIVGPSGCGKSTLLRMLAGLEEISSGEILIGGQVVNDWSPQRRNIAMVFQDYALYPHMTVRHNLEFPLRMQRIAKAEMEKRVDQAAELLGLRELMSRRPRQLSGGQRQRVAMGRAVVRRPSVFLMDEPLSNLDAKLRVQIRAEIAELQQRLGITTIYVTHDQVEAMTLGHRVAVLRDGALQQLAPPQELYAQPKSVFVATFLGSPGMNVFPARLSIDKRASDMVLLEDRWRVPARELPVHLRTGEHDILMGARPEAFLPASDEVAAPPLSFEVASVETLGHERLIYGRAVTSVNFEDRERDRLMGLGIRLGNIVARVPMGPPIGIGTMLTLGLPSDRLHLFDLNGALLRGRPEAAEAAERAARPAIAAAASSAAR